MRQRLMQGFKGLCPLTDYNFKGLGQCPRPFLCTISRDSVPNPARGSCPLTLQKDIVLLNPFLFFRLVLLSAAEYF